MIVPKNFFELEERYGFIVNERMKHVWAAQLKMLYLMDSICKKYNLKYVAFYGTMLGAVRHGGYIPWDDDMDLAMPREDYNKFLTVCEEEFPKYFKVNSYITTKGTHNTDFTTILNRCDVGDDDIITKDFYGCPFITVLDIYPLDYVNRDREMENLRTALFNAAYDLADRFEEFKKNGELFPHLERFEDLSKIHLDKTLPIRPQLWGAVEKLKSLFFKEESNGLIYLTDKISSVPNGEYYVSVNAMDNIIRVPFEYMDIPLPSNYADTLTLLYEDWRTPVQFIQEHEYPYYKKQLPFLKQPESYTITGGIQ